MTEVLRNTDLPIGKKHSGKVRDIYDLGSYLLIVTTDRISAFDVVLPDPVPGKGEVLNKMSALWLKRTNNLVSNHFLTDNPDKYPIECRPYTELLQGRSMLVKKARPLTVECIVRGYLSGSAWESYQKDRTVCGIELPPGLVESQELPTPIFTPSTKAPDGEHDINIPYSDMMAQVGGIVAAIARDASLDLYRFACKTAESAGIIIADTKLEFGIDEECHVILIDEVLTPDSSRFWPKNGYEPGRPQKSFDKQYVRDYLVSVKWDKKPPAPKLPDEIIEQTSAKYAEALERFSKVLG